MKKHLGPRLFYSALLGTLLMSMTVEQLWRSTHRFGASHQEVYPAQNLIEGTRGRLAAAESAEGIGVELRAEEEQRITEEAVRERRIVKLEQLQDRIRILIDGEVFTEYKYASDQKYPYFYPVKGPRSGKSVTTETSMPYPHHHSLFFGCDEVSGGNYWQEGLERGQIVSEAVEVEQAEGEEVVFTQINLWQRPGAPSPFRDRRHIRISAPSSELRVIDFEIMLEPLIDVRIDKTNHALFSARMVPELSVEGGGTLVNAQGNQGEEETWGVASPWCDYWGTRGDGTREGLAILTHPDNRWYPAPWFTRDYGFFSPTPMYWLEGDHLKLPEGKALHLRYRVLVHGGSTAEARIQHLYEDYAGR